MEQDKITPRSSICTSAVKGLLYLQGKTRALSCSAQGWSCSCSTIQRGRNQDCQGTGIVRLCQPVKEKFCRPKGERSVALILILPPFFCPSLLSLPPLSPNSQPQAFHRGDLSEEAEGSEEQVAPGRFADGNISGAALLGSPTNEHSCPVLPSLAPPELFPHFSKHLSFQPLQNPRQRGFSQQQLCPPLGT